MRIDRAHGDGEELPAGGRLMTDYLGRITAELAVENYEEGARWLGLMVSAKRRQYGKALERSSACMALLYDEPIQLERIQEAYTVQRVLEKLARIAAGDEGEESAWLDIAGHALVEAQRRAR